MQLRLPDSALRLKPRLSNPLSRSFRSLTKHFKRLNKRMRPSRKLLRSNKKKSLLSIRLPSRRNSRLLLMPELTLNRYLVLRLRLRLPNTKKHARKLNNSPTRN
jgi:hypothetical protein